MNNPKPISPEAVDDNEDDFQFPPNEIVSRVTCFTEEQLKTREEAIRAEEAAKREEYGERCKRAALEAAAESAEETLVFKYEDRSALDHEIYGGKAAKAIRAINPADIKVEE